MSDSYFDKPEFDGTPKGHPAFKRGQLKSTITLLKMVKSVVDGTDDGSGTVASPQIEAARRAILILLGCVKETTELSTSPSKKAIKALEAAQAEVQKINL